MNYYIDVLLKPDSEMRVNVLMNKTVTKLHKALYSIQSDSIGISFPEYKILLGNKLRIHGNHIMLSKLEENDWLGRLNGYCQKTPIQEIPKNISYRIISRKQCNMSNSKLKRLIKRKGLNSTEIKNYKIKMLSQGIDNPYLELESTTSHQLYRRFISFSPIQENETSGKFDSFGLSKTATIPWF